MVKDAQEGAARAILAMRDTISTKIQARICGMKPRTAVFLEGSGCDGPLVPAAAFPAYLAEAVSADDPELFVSFIARCKVSLSSRVCAPEVLATVLTDFGEVLGELLPADPAGLVLEPVRIASERFRSLPDGLPVGLDAEDAAWNRARRYLETLLDGDRRLACRLILEATDGGLPVKDVHLRVFQPALYEIGVRVVADSSRWRAGTRRISGRASPRTAWSRCSASAMPRRGFRCPRGGTPPIPFDHPVFGGVHASSYGRPARHRPDRIGKSRA